MNTTSATRDPRPASACPSRSPRTLPHVFIHPTALCETERVGAGTKVWAFAHLMDGCSVGSLCQIADHAFIESGARIGDRVVIKNGVMVFSGVTIQDDVFVGPGVVFTNDRFPRSRHMGEAAGRYRHPEQWLESTLIERGASLGAHATILCGVTVGRHGTVAAGAVVTRDVAQHALVAGNPARSVGWVCVCGLRLRSADDDGRRDERRCPGCNRRYSRRDGGLSSE